jgi:hypothetical protein
MKLWLLLVAALSKVIELDVTNFDQATQSNQYLMAMFYVPWW